MNGKYREFYMDTDLLDKALSNCDLGDGYSAKVRQYPHKDSLSFLTKVIEHSAYQQAQAEIARLKSELAILKLKESQWESTIMETMRVRDLFKSELNEARVVIEFYGKDESAIQTNKKAREFLSKYPRVEK